MSQSRSPTPTHYRPSNTQKSSHLSTKSRSISIDENISRPPPSTEAPPRPAQLILTSPPHSAAAASGSPETRLPEFNTPSTSKRKAVVLATDSPTTTTSPTDELPMAKRIRRGSPNSRGSRRGDRSSPSSDSQDGMADTESEVSKREKNELVPPSTAPPKKKRTRTLTTPHQSAVLHALLAQSRFPTTAMREEVGRSIGLSARKVQIWFQNQRQKARRPRSQGDPGGNRPPQYGPFPSAPESISQQTGRYPEPPVEHALRARLATQESGSLEIPGLLGPGMPGAATYSPQSYRAQGHSIPASAPPVESSHFLASSSQRPVTPTAYGSPRVYPMLGPRPATSQPMGWRERDPSRTLPPLMSSRPSSSTHLARPLHPSVALPSYNPTRPVYEHHRSISPEPRFAHHPPEPSIRPHLNIPPPFTLQPPPQWDESSFSPLPRPTSSGWARPGIFSTRGRSSSPITRRRPRVGSIGGTVEFSESYHHIEAVHLPPSSSPQSLASSSSAPPSRSGRYDPVRATFIPYSSPSPIVSPPDTGIHEPSSEYDPTRKDH